MGTEVGRDICHPRTIDRELEMGRLNMCLPVLIGSQGLGRPSYGNRETNLCRFITSAHATIWTLNPKP